MSLKGKLKSSRDDWSDDSESDGDHRNLRDILAPSVPIEIQRAAATAPVPLLLLPPPPTGDHPLPGSGLPSSTSQPSPLSSHSSTPRPPSQTQHSPLSPSSSSTPVTTVKTLPDISLSSVSIAPESTENFWQVIEDQGGWAKWRERYLGGPDSTLRDMSKEDQEYMTPVKPQGAGLGYGKYSGPPVRDISTLTLSELKNMKISDIFPTADELPPRSRTEEEAAKAVLHIKKSSRVKELLAKAADPQRDKNNATQKAKRPKRSSGKMARLKKVRLEEQGQMKDVMEDSEEQEWGEPLGLVDIREKDPEQPMEWK